MFECCLQNHGGSIIVIQEVCEESPKAGVLDQPIRWVRGKYVVKGKQIIISFHIDDCKISHESSAVIDDTIAWLRVEYKNIFEDGLGQMKVHRGKTHKDLGMSLDFPHKGQC